MAGKAEITMRNVLIAPSLLGADPLDIAGAVDSLHGCYDWLHLDIMDGHFVRNLSFGPEFCRALRKRYPDAFIDTHLMIDRLETITPLFMNAGTSSITIHAETEPQLLHASLSMIKNAGLKAGVALCPPTPVVNVKAVLELADLVLVMSVTPGFGGQKFIEGTLEKVRELVSLREVHRYNYLIEIDGGINAETISRAVRAGCDVIVMGSAVFAQEEPGRWLSDIKEAVRNFDRT